MSARATFVEGCDYTKIRLGEIELAEGECIKFKKGNAEAIGKIIAFGWHSSSPYANRIFFLPWIQDENRWTNHTIPMRSIPLEWNYFNDGNDAQWTTIEKL